MHDGHMDTVLDTSFEQYAKEKTPREDINCSDAEMRSIRYEIERDKGLKVVGMARDAHDIDHSL